MPDIIYLLRNSRPLIIIAVLSIILAIIFISKYVKQKKAEKRQLQKYESPPRARPSHETTPDHVAYYNNMPYIRENRLLSQQELEFYHVLCELIDQSFVICPKVGLADFVSIPENSDDYIRFKDNINGSADFLICDAETFSPLCVIELYDSNDDCGNTYDLYKSFNMPLVRFNVRHSCTKQDIVNLLEPYIGEEWLEE
jgi:hypothetical protein